MFGFLTSQPAGSVVQRFFLFAKRVLLRAKFFFSPVHEEIRKTLWLLGSEKPLVVFYFASASHEQTCSHIIRELLKRGGYKLLCLSAYPRPDNSSSVKEPDLGYVGGVHNIFLTGLSTHLLVTPVVGYPRDRVPTGAKVMHPLVSLTSLDGVYRQDHFDGVDFVVCAGRHQVESFIALRQRRPSLKGKCLLLRGYPRLDLALEERLGLPVRTPAKVRRVIYAPTHVYSVNAELASLRRQGEQIIDSLMAEGFEVIFRPHPASLTDEDSALVQRIADRHGNNQRFTFDRSKNYVATYAGADAMVTDLSGTGFTFAFTFERPAIFFCDNPVAEKGLKGIQFESRERAGGLVRSTPELIQRLREVFSNENPVLASIRSLRREVVENLGHSGMKIAEDIDRIMRNEPIPDRITL